MANVTFTELSPPSGLMPVVAEYDNVDSYDIVSDPMTVNNTVTGYGSDGTPTIAVAVSSFLQSEYSAEVS